MLRPFVFNMRRIVFLLTLFLLVLTLLAFILQFELPGYTQFTLVDPDTHTRIFSAALRDGEPVMLTWHNSIFDLDVTEEFTATNGMLVQHAVTFADPRGTPPMVARPQDLADLYHTGGPFVVRGIAKPFTRITYRIGEIGNPQFHIHGQTIALKPVVGFGGRVILTVEKIRGIAWLASWIRY